MAWKYVLALIAAGGILAAGGCTKEEFNRLWEKDKGSQPEAITPIVSKTAALRGTVGELVTIDGLRLLQVRGFGLVVDLADTGGSDGPEQVKQYIMKEMRRRQTSPDSKLSPADMLKGRDVALVEVTGLVPAAADTGEPFDVVVRAMGTQTTSLAGGRLFLCDLKPYGESVEAILNAKTVATATGPVFISPIGLEKEVPTRIDLRVGLVLGGGRAMKPRTVRLVLNESSPSSAMRIVDRLNGRYGKEKPVASGKSIDAIELTIPKEYRERKRLFFEHVLHTMLNNSPTALEQRAKDLGVEIVHPDAEFESIGCAWEAIGRIALPHIREFYFHPLPATNFYAGRTGLRLGDTAGLEVVVKHALNPESSFREQAIEDLGYATNMYGAGECLRKLLDESDTSLRLRAYKALRHSSHPAISTEVLCDDNLILDTVESNGPHMIYVQRSMAPRVAVFGKQMRCRPPLTFPADRRDNRFLCTQISAQPDDDHLTVLFKNKHVKMTSPVLSRPLEVVPLIRYLGGSPKKNDEGEVEGLAVPYDEIVDILHTLCETGAIAADFQAEDLTGMETSTDITQERKESEY
jgi:hypothetical protein